MKRHARSASAGKIGSSVHPGSAGPWSLAWLFVNRGAGRNSDGIPTVWSFSMKQYGGQFGTSVPKYRSKPRVVGPPAIGWRKTSRHSAFCSSLGEVTDFSGFREKQLPAFVRDRPIPSEMPLPDAGRAITVLFQKSRNGQAIGRD